MPTKYCTASQKIYKTWFGPQVSLELLRKIDFKQSSKYLLIWFKNWSSNIEDTVREKFLEVSEKNFMNKMKTEGNS